MSETPFPTLLSFPKMDTSALYKNRLAIELNS